MSKHIKSTRLNRWLNSGGLALFGMVALFLVANVAMATCHNPPAPGCSSDNCNDAPEIVNANETAVTSIL